MITLRRFRKKRKDAVIPNEQATGISPAEYFFLIGFNEKASESC